MNINIEAGVCGLFQFETFRCDENGVEIPGSRQIKVPFFPNLITDAGLNRMGEFQNWKAWCQVGSGTATPTVLDSALASRIAGSNSITNTIGSSAEAPWYGWSRNVYRFAAGVATGNIAEVGVGWANTGSLFSRALVVDSGGNPTTITVLADEFLDVTYEFRQYAPASDGAGTVTLGGVDYSYAARAAEANLAAWRQSVGGSPMGVGTGGSQPSLAYNGAIGAITGSPSGANTFVLAEKAAYVNNSLAAKTLVTASPAQGNLAGGIKSIRLSSLGVGSYQIEFTPNIPKTTENSLSLTVSYSWARKTL